MAISVSASESIRSVLKADSSSNFGNEEYRVIHLAGPDKEIPTEQIYKKSMLCGLNFLRNYKIKSVKKSFSLDCEQHDIYLLTRDEIRMHKSKYDQLHIGLVQVRVERYTLSNSEFDKES